MGLRSDKDYRCLRVKVDLQQCGQYIMSSTIHFFH